MSANPPEFVVRVPTDDERNVVYVAGEIDLDTAPQLQASVDRLISGSSGEVVIDLGNVHYIDSSGLSVLLTASATLTSEGRSLRLARPSPQVDLLLEVAGVRELFQFGSHPAAQDA